MRIRMTAILSTTLLALFAGAALAQECDDFNACTVDDVCNEGTCVGTPLTSGPCDDLNDCTINDQCMSDGTGCRGDPAPSGTSCASGCGTCLPIDPAPGSPTKCLAGEGSVGMPCDPGVDNPCLEGRCMALAENAASCQPQLKACPDTDGNPCTDNCNPMTGACERDASKCAPTCETCNPASGACVPANVDAECDDSDVCTQETHCQVVNAGGVDHGVCMVGGPTDATPTDTPSGETPTATSGTPATPSGATPTATEGTPPPTPPPGACVGDCNGDHMVAVNELVTGVNIALGTAPLSQCESFDVDGNGNGSIEVNELVGGVAALLFGCA